MDLPLVMSNLGLRDGALDIVAFVGGARVIGGEDGGGGADDGADVIVHGFRLGLVYQLVADDRAGRSIAGGLALGDGHVRVLM